MVKVKKIALKVWRPVYVLALCVVGTLLANSTRLLNAQEPVIVIPHIVGTDFGKVSMYKVPESANGVQFQIIAPVTANVALNSAVKDYIDQQVATFEQTLPAGPTFDGFLHQLRIVPSVNYVSDTAIAISLELDEYHPSQEVTSRFITWYADSTGVHQELATKALATDLAKVLQVNDVSIFEHPDQAVALSALPNHAIRLYKSGLLAPYLNVPYKDIDSNQFKSLASLYRKLFYNSYDAVLQPAALTGLNVQYQRILTKQAKAPTNCDLESCVALTFDDGPNVTNTPKVLNILHEHAVPATFFELGVEVQRHPEIAKQVLAEGHEIENHSFAHPDFVKLRNPILMRKEISATQDTLQGIGASPKYFRPPYGSVNNTVRSTVNMPLVFWNVDAQEWRTGSDGSSTARSILAQTRPGAIILMHDTRTQTPDALPAILDNLLARGYKFVKVQDLLHIDAAARGDFRSKK